MPAWAVIIAALLGTLATLVLAHGFLSGAWLGGILHAAVIGGAAIQWLRLRGGSDEARAAADSMIFFVFLLSLFIARPALSLLP